MKKIPTVFTRDESTNRRYVTSEVAAGCEWVLAGEGVPTRKYDGTCVMLALGGNWWARREVKPGKGAPEDFVEIEHDDVTGKTVGWEPIQESSFAKWHADALAYPQRRLPGTYELCGPKVNSDPERYLEHVLIEHANAELLPGVPRDFDGLRDWLLGHEYEGIVWHHPDGRMAKLKRRDFPQATP